MKDSKAQKSKAPVAEPSQELPKNTPNKPKVHESKQQQKSDNIFALMGQALNQSSPPKAKTTKESFFPPKGDHHSDKNSSEINEQISGQKEQKKTVVEDQDEEKFKEVDEFTKMFQKINSFKETRSNLTDEQRKEQATKIMMDLMKGFGEDLTNEDLEKL